MADIARKSTFLTVDEARDRILADLPAPRTESVPLDLAHGRTLHGDLPARRTQPPSAMSSMDGYALRAADCPAAGATFTIIGAAPAGMPFGGKIRPGEAVRIFTGGVMPDGTDAVLIQEDAEVSADGRITSTCGVHAGENVRHAGSDFRAGDVLMPGGTFLAPHRVALAAAAGWPEIVVARRPLVAIIATGTELRLPGAELGPGDIVASNGFAIAGIVRAMGGDVLDLGIIPDDEALIGAALERALAEGASVIVTLGGASVGEHDLIRKVTAQMGMVPDFWKIAMRPGKPLIHGRFGTSVLLGLPGNPVSSVVCSHVFLAPLVAALQGRAWRPRAFTAILDDEMPANGPRTHYARAQITSTDASGLPHVRPFSRQDSSLLGVLAGADCLVIHEAGEAARQAGETIQAISLDLT